MELAKSSYQLPRLSRMWTHLERQAGGQSKGMGEKQKEVDKRILRGRMAALRQELDEVRVPAPSSLPLLGASSRRVVVHAITCLKQRR